MLGLRTPELIVILFIILLLFGGRKLPELARSMGSAVREYTQASKEPIKVIEVLKDVGEWEREEKNRSLRPDMVFYTKKSE